MKPAVLILVFSNIRSDARVQRQIRALEDEYDVTVACFAGDPSPTFKLITFEPTNLTLIRKVITSFFLLSRMYGTAYRLLHGYPVLKKQLSGNRYNLIIANDVETLPLAFSFGTKVLFDAHEYAPRHFEDRKMWRIFFQQFNIWLCKKYIPKVAAMTTVGRALAKEYERNFHVKPTVLTNASRQVDLKPTPLDGDRIRLVHHGIANRSRRLELMIEMMNYLDNRFSLDMMLLVPGSASASTIQFLEDLKRQASADTRIRFITPVKSDDVTNAINGYDMGVFLLPPINFNYANTLPNKFFDFIQARLGVAIGPTPEMAEIVNDHGLGVVADDFTARSLADKLNGLKRSDIESFKVSSDKLARVLNAENNATLLRGLVRQIISA